jgi:hypothetical protein
VIHSRVCYNHAKQIGELFEMTPMDRDMIRAVVDRIEDKLEGNLTPEGGDFLYTWITQSAAKSSVDWPSDEKYRNIFVEAFVKQVFKDSRSVVLKANHVRVVLAGICPLYPFC